MKKPCVYVCISFCKDHMHRIRDRTIVIRPTYDVRIILVGDKKLMRAKGNNITELA